MRSLLAPCRRRLFSAKSSSPKTTMRVGAIDIRVFDGDRDVSGEAISASLSYLARCFGAMTLTLPISVRLVPPRPDCWLRRGLPSGVWSVLAGGLCDLNAERGWENRPHRRRDERSDRAAAVSGGEGAMTFRSARSMMMSFWSVIPNWRLQVLGQNVLGRIHRRDEVGILRKDESRRFAK